jgi:hypothetical protein
MHITSPGNCQGFIFLLPVPKSMFCLSTIYSSLFVLLWLLPTVDTHYLCYLDTWQLPRGPFSCLPVHILMFHLSCICSPSFLFPQDLYSTYMYICDVTIYPYKSKKKTEITCHYSTYVHMQYVTVYLYIRKKAEKDKLKPKSYICHSRINTKHALLLLKK